MEKRIRLGLMGGGLSSFIGIVHRIAAYMGENYTLVGGVFDIDHAKGNEMRIAELKRVLDDAHARLETNHSFSRLSGHASADFSKER